MSTPRYIREYLTAHPDAHRDEVIDRLGYDFEHETVRGPVYDSWGESVMDEHNCLELREELQELLASFKTEDSKAAYEIARLGLNPQQLTEYRTSISSFVTSCLDAYEPKLTDFIVEAVDPEEEVRPAGSLRVQFLDGYGDRLVGTYVRLAPAAANSSPDQPLRMELSREMVIENSEGYESPDMLPSVRHAVQRHLLTHYDQIREEAIAVTEERSSELEAGNEPATAEMPPLHYAVRDAAGDLAARTPDLAALYRESFPDYQLDGNSTLEDVRNTVQQRQVTDELRFTERLVHGHGFSWEAAERVETPNPSEHLFLCNAQGDVVMKVNPETTQAEVDREQAWAKEREPVVAVLAESYRKAGRPEKFVSEFAKRLDEALKSAQIDGKTFSLNVYDRNAPPRMPSQSSSSKARRSARDERAKHFSQSLLGAAASVSERQGHYRNRRQPTGAGVLRNPCWLESEGRTATHLRAPHQTRRGRRKIRR